MYLFEREMEKEIKKRRKIYKANLAFVSSSFFHTCFFHHYDEIERISVMSQRDSNLYYALLKLLRVEQYFFLFLRVHPSGKKTSLRYKSNFPRGRKKKRFPYLCASMCEGVFDMMRCHKDFNAPEKIIPMVYLYPHGNRISGHRAKFHFAGHRNPEFINSFSATVY